MDENLLSGIAIFIPVKDLNRSTNWYREMLGFKVLHHDEPKANVLKIWNGIVVFCLVKSYDIVQPSFPKNDYNVDHYMNFHTENIESIHRDLLDKSANVGEIHEFEGMKGFELYDLDGNRFSVIE